MGSRAHYFSPRHIGSVPWLVAAAALLWATTPPAAAADATALSREANTELRNAQRAMFSRKFEQSLEHVKKAEKLIAELKAADPAHRSLRTLESKLARQQKDLAKRMGKTLPPVTPKGKETPPAAKGTGTELPSAVAFRLKRLDQWISGGNLPRAAALMEEIETRYGDQIPAGHPAVAAAKARLAELKKKIEAEEQAKADAKKKEEADKARREAQSQEWVAKLAVYTKRYDVANSRVNPKYLIAAVTQDMKELQRHKALYDEVAVLFAAYKKVAFPAGKTFDLEQMEERLAKTLKEFPEAYQRSLALMSGGAERLLKEAAAALEHDQAWRTDATKVPYPLSEKRLESIRAGVARVAGPKLPELKAKLAALEKDNAERRRLRTERTFMIPDRFTGAEAGQVKAAAVALVRKSFADAQALRTTIISADWKEVDKVEFTDTTRTAIRRRVTRSVTAQVAAKTGGAVQLYTVYVAKDRRTDGTWGPLYGNLHQSAETMLESNVSRHAP